MKQFYETYKDHPKLSSLLREISWTHNLLIFSRCKTIEEKEFYIKITTRNITQPESSTDKFREVFLKEQRWVIQISHQR